MNIHIVRNKPGKNSFGPVLKLTS